MIDSHCHLNYIEKSGSINELVREANDQGVHTIINIGADLESSEISVDLSRKHKSVFASVGIHPHDAKTLTPETFNKIELLAADSKVVAIGEIGLDYYRNLSPKDVQQQAFRQQLELAIKLELPVVIHTRDSFDDTYTIVKEYASSLKGGVFHCFQGDARQAAEVIQMGFVISAGGIITFKNASMAEMVTEVPLEYILLETDAPYLTPVPFRGKTNRPAYVRYVYEHMAKLKQCSLANVETTVDRSVQKLFGLVETFGG